MTLPPNFNHIATYGFALIFTKMLAVFCIPLVTGSISPAEFGKLELIVAVVECVGLMAGLAIAEVFNRVAQEKEKHASLIGAVLVVSIINIALLQGLAFLLVDANVINPKWVHASLFTAGLGAMIDLPLAQLRFQNRSKLFAGVVMTRTLVQLLLIYIFLQQGFGIGAIIYTNLIVEICVCLFLLASVPQFALSKEAFMSIYKLSLPYILGGLAMFIVGNADRWFLLQYVSLEQIAFYGIALKLSLMVALFSHAFHMWWGPRKYAIYDELGGALKTQKIMLAGFALNLAGGIGVLIFAPIFVKYMMPVSYLPLLQFIPFLVLISFLNETATLVSLGAYRAKTGLPILQINGAGAFIALLGYCLLIPNYGIYGAITATVLAHLLRILLYTRMSLKTMPLFKGTLDAHG